MPRYTKERPIILYSRIIDVPDLPNVVRGIPDNSEIEEVKVVILRPSGDEHSKIIPTLETIDGFGTWYTAKLVLDFSEPFGTYTIRWVYRTSNGEFTDEYPIEIESSPGISSWCFQPIPEKDDSVPDDVAVLIQ